MQNRNTLQLLEEFEKKDHAANRIKVTFETLLRLVLQLLLTNTLIYVLRKLSKYE